MTLLEWRAIGELIGGIAIIKRRDSATSGYSTVASVSLLGL